MENNKKSAGTIALVVLLLIVTIASLVLATYAWAKYTTTESGNASANVAKWNVNFTDGNSSFTGSYSHVASTKIAPGTQGSFDITVNPNDTETCFDYTIHCTGVELLDKNGNTVTTIAADVTSAQVLSHISITGEGGENFKTTDLTGTFNLGTNHNGTAATSTNGTQTISWAWPYEIADAKNESEDNIKAYDRIDTAAGEYAAANDGLQLKVNYTITATQVNPNTAIPAPSGN